MNIAFWDSPLSFWMKGKITSQCTTSPRLKVGHSFTQVESWTSTRPGTITPLLLLNDHKRTQTDEANFKVELQHSSASVVKVIHIIIHALPHIALWLILFLYKGEVVLIFKFLFRSCLLLFLNNCELPYRYCSLLFAQLIDCREIPLDSY